MGKLREDAKTKTDQGEGWREKVERIHWKMAGTLHL